MPDSTPVLDCRSAMQQLWDFVDGELTEDRMVAVRLHLDSCTDCHPHADFAERFISALHGTRDDRRCPNEVRAKVMQSLKEAGLTLT